MKLERTTTRRMAVLGIAAAAIFGAAPAVANATSQNVSGTVCTCGTWAYYDNPRTQRLAGNISLAMTDKTAGNTYIQLRRNVAHDGASNFTDVRTFSSTGTQVIGAGVRAGTRFYINARMDRQSLPFRDNSWAGQLVWNG